MEMVMLRIVASYLLFFPTASAFRPTGCRPLRAPPGSSRKWGKDFGRGKNQRPTLSLRSKTYEEDQFIKDALLANALFADLPVDSIQELVDAFEKKEAFRGEKIVSQGDSCEGGCVYLVANGKCRVFVDGAVVPEPYGTIGPNLLFGELGVLYDEKRSATISARSSKVTYYQVFGDTFKSILNKPTESLLTMHEIDALINQVSGTQALYGGDIIPPYKPERSWLWRQFAGTILKISVETTLLNMLACTVFVTFAREASGEPLWSMDFTAPDKTLPFVQRLSLVHEIWDIQKALTTFVLTFFVNQSFNFWNKVYSLARDVQGKLNGFNLLLASNVLRDEHGDLTAESDQFLDEIGQYSRLFHVLLWASKSKRFAVLTRPEGLQRMESRGMMSAKQLEVLENLELPTVQLYSAPLEWMMIRSNQAMDKGTLAGDTATKGMLLKELASLRSAFCTISDKLNGRMPLPYAHFVQILVDTFVLTAPIALYAELGEFSVIAVGLITLFYTGLNNMAKIFLDPLNNENFCENAIFMDLGVLIREGNGISTQWKKAGAKLPF